MSQINYENPRAFYSQASKRTPAYFPLSPTFCWNRAYLQSKRDITRLLASSEIKDNLLWELCVWCIINRVGTAVHNLQTSIHIKTAVWKDVPTWPNTYLQGSDILHCRLFSWGKISRNHDGFFPKISTPKMSTPNMSEIFMSYIFVASNV